MELNVAGWLVILVGRAGLNRARWLAVLDPDHSWIQRGTYSV